MRPSSTAQANKKSVRGDRPAEPETPANPWPTYRLPAAGLVGDTAGE